MNTLLPSASISAFGPATASAGQEVPWLERVLPRIMRRLLDAENLELPLLQLPLAQMRLAQALYLEGEDAPGLQEGQTMSRLSERLGVRHNALTQAADRLVNHGLAERLADATDRRVVRLRLTGRGQEWVGERRDRRRAHLQQLWETLSADERQVFLQAVQVLEGAAMRLETSRADAGKQTSATLRDDFTVEETLSRCVGGTDSDKFSQQS